MENLHCPMCDTSDFKDDNGYYVCQICGHKIPKENTVSMEKKGANKVIGIIALVIFGYMAVSKVLSIYPQLNYYFISDEIYLDEIIFLAASLLCLITLICFIASAIRTMQGKGNNGTRGKTIGFILYAIGEAVPAIFFTIVNTIYWDHFDVYEILYAIPYIVLVWVAVYKLEKWIK